MNGKEIKFFDFVFESFIGSDTDEYGKKYSDVYIYELKELIDSLQNDLTSLLNIYNEYTRSDVEKLFAINFYGIAGRIEDTDLLPEIAIRFDELYGDQIGDKYEYGKE